MRGEKYREVVVLRDWQVVFDPYNARSLQPVTGCRGAGTLAVRRLVKKETIRQFVWALVLEGVLVRNQSAQVTCIDSFVYSDSCAEPGFVCLSGLLDECTLLPLGDEDKD